MTEHAVGESARIRGSAADIYRLLADYRVGHPRTLPPHRFRDLRVEAGGHGAGTRIRFTMTFAGSPREFVSEITEPIPGELLEERVIASGARTTFRVTPAEEPGFADVRIETRWATPGLKGWVERLVLTGYLRKVYREQLQRIADVIDEDSRRAP